MNKNLREVIRDYPEVTSRGIFMLSVSDVGNPIFLGKFREQKIAVYEAIVVPEDPKYQHLFYVLYHPPGKYESSVPTFFSAWSFEIGSANQAEAMDMLLVDIHLKYEDHLNGIN